MSVTVEEMTVEAEQFLKEAYNLTLDIPIKRNNRLKATLGWFSFNKKHGALDIEISGKFMDYGSRSDVIDCLRHELVHYALYTLGKPYNDGDAYFEEELRKHGISSSGSGPYLFGPVVRYDCEACNKHAVGDNLSVLKRPQRFRSKCCGAKLINVRKDTIYGDYKEELN